jgi:hypothetical protein
MTTPMNSSVSSKVWFNLILFLVSCFVLQTTMAENIVPTVEQVKVANVQIDDNNSSPTATLSGSFTDGCPRIVTNKIAGPDKSAILIVEMYAAKSGSELCTMSGNMGITALVPFTDSVDLRKDDHGKPLAPGQYLLRVQNKDGRAIEKGFMIRSDSPHIEISEGIVQ